MLHHADNGIKGGKETFAAFCMKVCCAENLPLYAYPTPNQFFRPKR
jgi:hypothetical protein